MLSNIDDVYQIVNDANPSPEDHGTSKNVLCIKFWNPVREKQHVGGENRDEEFVAEVEPIFEFRVQRFMVRFIHDNEQVKVL